MRTTLLFVCVAAPLLAQDLKGIDACNDAIRLIDEGRPAEALKVLDGAKGSMDAEDEWLWWGNRGHCHRDLRQDSKALEAYGKAMELKSDCWFRLSHATLLHEFGKWDDALKCLDGKIDAKYDDRRKTLRAVIEGPYRKRWPRASKKLEYIGKMGHYLVVSAVGTTTEELDRIEKELSALDPNDKMYGFKSEKLLKPSPDLVNVYNMLEASRKQYMKFVGIDERDMPKGKVFKVFFLRNREEFVAFEKECGGDGDSENLAGFYDPNHKYIQLYSEEGTGWVCGIARESLDTFWHEGWHQFFDALTEQKPIWLNEGLAEFLSKGEVDDSGAKITLGLLPPGSDRVTRLERIQEMIGKNGTIPFRKFFKFGSKEWHTGNVNEHYAEAWAICYYALRGNNEAFRKDFGKFFRELVKGRRVDEVLKEVFPDAKLDEYEKGWLAYIKGL